MNRSRDTRIVPSLSYAFVDYLTSTTKPVTTSAAAHIQSRLNQAFRRRLRPSLRYTTHAASAITVRYARVWMATAIASVAATFAPGETMWPACAWLAADSVVGMDMTNGNTMNPAPCAEAMRNDQAVRSRKPTCIPPNLGCPCLQSL